MPAVLAPRRRGPADPRSDPRFQKVEAKLKGDATRLKQHPPARKKAAEAQAAAKGPANEKLAGAKANQVGKMEQAPTGKPDENSFLALLRSEIEKALPKNNEEAKDFIDADQKQQITQNVRGNVKEQRDSAAKNVETAAKEPPNQAGVSAKEVTPIPGEAPPGAPQVDAAGAMPAPKPDADISLEQSKKSADQEMADNKVTPTQLKKANDPRFSAVLDSKSAVEKQADSAPQQYRAAERGILTSTGAKATADARTGSAALSLVKRNAGAKVSAHQSAAKLRDEQRRQEFTNKIEGIYNKTKADVENKLSTMESDVTRDFDAGIDAALANMKSSAQRDIDAFYDDRYSGLLGWTDWIADKFKDTPQQVKDIIKRARGRFTTEMDRLVVRIAANVEQRLKEAKDLIAKGQADVKAEVAKLPANLQAFGRQAEQEMAGRFDEMRQGVEDRKNALAQKLAEKYKEASAKADEAAKKMEEENAGLFNKFAKYLGEIVKIILEFKDKLMALLRKAADLIMDILSDPIGFLGNLLGAIKKGVGQFVDNVWTHLKRGFMEWLFGSLASAGIEIPSDLSLPSILKLVMGILGLTYDRLRAKAVKLIGERNVQILEKLYDYVKTLITEGPAALWAKVKDDLSNLKEMVIDAIQSWLIETVVKQAVIKLLSFFNPAGAFVQACIAIYNTVMFLIERASQIMAFVEAVINSVAMIVAGNIGAAASWIENSLGKMIPLLIGFLARLIGLGGITDKIKEIIKKVQAFVDKAIDKVLSKIVAVVKKLFGKLTGKDQDKDKEKDKEKDKGEADLDLAMLAPLPKVELPFSLGRSSHRMIFNPADKGMLKMATVAEPIETKFKSAHAALDNWKRYLGSIQDQKVKSEFEKDWKPQIEALVALQTGQYKELYDKYYDEFAQRVANAKQAAAKSGKTFDQKEFEQKKAKEGVKPPAQAPAEKFVKAATAEIQRLIDNLRHWALLQKAGDLTPENIDKIISEGGERIWNEEWQDRKKKVEAILKRYSPQVPGGGPILYHGSLLRGFKGPHKGRVRFDPNAFDVDAYIVSKEVHAKALESGARTTAPGVTAKILASTVTGEVGAVREIVFKIRGELTTVEGVNAAAFDIHIRRNPL